MIIEKHKYKIPIFLLLFGIIFCIVSALSFVSVAIQFILSNLKKSEIENLFQSDLPLREKFQKVKKKDVLHDVISVSSVFTGLIGTIIWGYGDLLY